LDLRLILKIN